jgi:hypothetical protein
VAYLPLGKKLKNALVVKKDMKGVESCGVMLAYTEMGCPEPRDPPQPKAAPPAEAAAQEKKPAEAKEEGKAQGKKGKKGKKNKGGKAKGGKKGKKGKKVKLRARFSSSTPSSTHSRGPLFLNWASPSLQ